MRAKTYLSMLALASIILATFAAAIPPAKSSPGNVKISALYRHAPWIPGQPAGRYIFVIVDIESPWEWDLTEDGIVGWTFDVHVDPAVLTPWSALGANLDYFLYDCVDWNQDPYGPFDGTNYPSLLVGELNKTTGDIIDISEFIMGYKAVGVGAGGTSYPEDYWYGMGYGLCRLRFRTKSATLYTKIDISDAAYWTPDGVKHPIPDEDITDGHYNEPIPEFPVGAAAEVGLMVAVVYLWFRRRRRLKEVP